MKITHIEVGLTKRVQLRDFEPAEPFVKFTAEVAATPEEAEADASKLMQSVVRVIHEGFAVPVAKGGKPVLVMDNTKPADPDDANRAILVAEAEANKPATPAAADDMGLPPADPGPRQDLDTYVTDPQVDHAAAAKVELSDLQEAAAKAAAKIKPAEVKKLIAVHGKSLAEVPEDKYEELLAALKGAQ